jgi:hypothetical protein
VQRDLRTAYLAQDAHDLLELADWAERSTGAAHVEHGSRWTRQAWITSFVLRHELLTRARAGAVR